MSTDVVQVPDLAPTPATTITAEDIAVPRLYVGNQMSEAVVSGLVKFGDLFLATDSEDPEPRVLWSLADRDDPEQGVVAHVLQLWKGKSYQAVAGGEITRFTFDDPDAPADAYTTYNYTLFLPEVDPDLPAKMLLKKGSKSTADRINTALVRNAALGPYYNTAFRITTQKRSFKGNTWAIHSAAVTPANPEYVEQAAALAAQLSPAHSTPTRSDEPAI